MELKDMNLDELIDVVEELKKEVNKLKRQVSYVERVLMDNDLEIDEENQYSK